MRKETIALWLLSAIAVLGFCAWRYRQPPALRAQVALLYDRSESMAEGCDAVVSMAEHALTLPHVREGSILSFFATGDKKTGLEPLLVATYDLPVSRRATESDKRMIERQRAFVEDLRKRCTDLPSTNTSPIVQSLKQVAAHLNSLGDDHTVRFLLARTDLLETVELSVKRALGQRLGAPAPVVSIENTGITMMLCGTAEIKSSGKATPERVKEVWTPLFTRSDLVQFQPYCPLSPAQVATPK